MKAAWAQKLAVDGQLGSRNAIENGFRPEVYMALLYGCGLQRNCGRRRSGRRRRGRCNRSWDGSRCGWMGLSAEMRHSPGSQSFGLLAVSRFPGVSRRCPLVIKVGLGDVPGVLRLAPHWKKSRVLELSPRHFRETMTRLSPEQLATVSPSLLARGVRPA